MLLELNELNKTVKLFSNTNGIKKEKVISMQDFISSVINAQNLGEKTPFKKINGALYRSIDGVTLIQTKQYDSNSYIYVLKRDKMDAQTKIFNREYNRVGYPALLFAVKVVNDKVVGCCIVAVKDSTISKNTVIYEYPYTNVSGENGNLCLGRNTFDVDTSIDEDYIYKVPNMIVNMPCSLHSFSQRNNTKNLTMEQLVILFENKEFDDDLLVVKDNYFKWFERL